MPQNIVYEITQLMSDKNNIQKDMNHVKNSITSMFEDKYMSKINNAFKTHEALTLKSPPREVELLKALKNYTPLERHTKVEGLINTILMVGTLSSIKDEVTLSKAMLSASDVNSSSSIHKDGVYDIEPTPLPTINKTNNLSKLILIMSIMNKG
jgi:hypothetical protein